MTDIKVCCTLLGWNFITLVNPGGTAGYSLSIQQIDSVSYKEIQQKHFYGSEDGGGPGTLRSLFGPSAQ